MTPSETPPAPPLPATSVAKSPPTLGTDYILNALAEEGLSHLFMVPGGLVDPFMPALTRHCLLYTSPSPRD